MDKKNKRVLWLINHQTLMEFEPALLEDLNFEVYIPKIFPQTFENRSASVSYEFDRTLSIPEKKLELLNNFNFYTTKLTPQIRKIMNSYFNVIIVPAYPLMVQQAIEHFEGHIILRAFGHARDIQYSTSFESELGSSFHETIQKLGSRFHFGVAYPGLEQIEPHYLKTRTLYLPLGLPNHFFSEGDIWEGDDPHLFFICPLINDNPYYSEIYRQFKQNFKDIPHYIGGWQKKKIDDSTVLGTLERSDLDLFFKKLRVLFYHSQEPRHIHYHPLEAMAIGMPVVFMQDGILGQIDKTGKQPGACKTISEARKKIRRILEGDKELINDIRLAQKRLLFPFKYEFCVSEWTKNFISATKEIPPQYSNRSQHIAVMLPVAYKSGTYDAAKNIAKMIHKGSRTAGKPVNVIFSFLKDQYNLKTDFNDLKDLGISLRETTWEEVDRDAVERILRMDGHTIPLGYSHYLIPRDGKRDFLDADTWLIVSDSCIYPPAPLRQYGVVIHDCLSRYYKIYQNEPFKSGRTNTARCADYILTTTPQTREDVISFHGVSPDRVFLSPLEFGMDVMNIPTGNQQSVGNYFIWPTNPSPHKNHLTALEGLIKYYSDGGKLNVIVTGFDIEQLDINAISDENIGLPEFKKFRQLLRSNKTVLKHIEVKSNLTKREYYTELKNACFIWHPAFLDNGTFTVIEAAALGVPGLSSDYPQMRYIDAYFGLNLAFFDPESPVSIAEGLHIMEKGWKKRRTLLPSFEKIQEFGWENLSEMYWQMIEGLI